MDAITPWLTPALLVALFAWLRNDVRELRHELASLAKDVAELRERMAKLEGALEGFLAGRRDRDAA